MEGSAGTQLTSYTCAQRYSVAAKGEDAAGTHGSSSVSQVAGGAATRAELTCFSQRTARHRMARGTPVRNDDEPRQERRPLSRRQGDATRQGRAHVRIPHHRPLLDGFLRALPAWTSPAFDHGKGEGTGVGAERREASVLGCQCASFPATSVRGANDGALLEQPGGAGSSRPPPALQHKFEGHLTDLGVRAASPILPKAGPDASSLAVHDGSPIATHHGSARPQCLADSKLNALSQVGGLLLFRFNLISPPTDIIIFSIKVKINQQFILRSSVDPTYAVRPPSDARTVFVLDCSHAPNFGRIDAPNKGGRSGSHTPNVGPLKVVSRGTEYKLHHLARLPNDNVIRPSSQPGSEVGISVQHDIAIEVSYRAMTEAESEGKDKGKGKGKEVTERRKLVISKPLDIFSVRYSLLSRLHTLTDCSRQCCCFVDSLTLPVYSLFDPNPAPESYSPPCVCGMKMGPLILSHGDTLLREEGEQGLTYAPVMKDDDQRSGSSTPVHARGREGRTPRETMLRQDSADSRNSDY